MKEKHIQLLACLFSLTFVLSLKVIAQESIKVPQLLHKNVRAFKLTIDSLQNINTNIQAETKEVLQDLKIIQKKMHLLPKESRTYRLQYKEYEKKLSEYWAKKHAMLWEMQNLRDRTLSSLQVIIDNLVSQNTEPDNQLLVHVQENIRKNDEAISQVRLEMLQILEKLKDPEIQFQEKQRLTRKFTILQKEKLTLFETHHQRLQDLHQLASKPNSELPVTQVALLTIKDDLDNRYAWVDTEIAYLNLYASYRQNRLDVDSKLVEVSGLVERFGDMITQLNTSRDLITEVENFERELSPARDSTSLAIRLPALQLPGRESGPVLAREFTAQEIDSLYRQIELDLQSSSQNNH